MKRTFIVALATMMSVAGAFAQPTVDAVLSTDEYGTGNTYTVTDGITTWYLTWDNTNLYGFVEGANQDEDGVMYFDFDNSFVVNSGNGTQQGITKDDISANVSFNADALIYFSSVTRQVRTYSGTWSSATTGWGTYADDDNGNGPSSDDRREFSIAWTALGLGARPTAMNFLCFLQYRNGTGTPAQFGGVYGQFPQENPFPTTNTNQALTASMVRYYHLPTMNSVPTSTPFRNNSYCHVGTDVIGFGAVSAYNFTMNTSGRTVTRGSGASGDWIITNRLIINNGAVDFGATASSCQIHHLDLSGGSLTLSTAAGGDMSLTGNWTQAKTATFNPTGRTVVFNGTSAETVTITSGGTCTFGGLTINNTSTGVNISSGTNLTVNNTCTFTSGKVTIGSDTLTLNGDLVGSNSTLCFSLNGETTVMFGGTGTPTSSFFVDQTTPNVTNRAANLVVNRTAGTVTLGDTLQIMGVVSHLDGVLASTAAAFLRLKATDSTSYGMISGAGTGDITGNVYAEFVIDGGGDFWRQICSPFRGNTLADYADDVSMNFGTPSPANTNVYYLDETQGGTPGAWRPHASTSASIDSTGFTVWVFDSQIPLILDIAGAYDNDDYTTFPLSRTGALADTTGYHIIRNPWPSNYHHNTTINNLVSNTIYIYEGNSVRFWNGATGSIANGVIHPFKALYVEVDVDGNTLTLPSANRVTTNNNNYFNKSGLQNYVSMRVVNPSKEWDETFVYTDAAATNDKDFWDANKIMNGPSAPSIYSLAGGAKSAINVLNNIPEDGIRIPVVFKTTTVGTHNIQFAFENIEADYEVILEDVWTQKKHDISKGVYTFEHVTGAVENRFILVFQRKTGGNISVAEADKTPTVFVGSNYKTVTVSSGNANGPCDIEVMDMMGRTLKTINGVDFSQTPVYNFSVDNAATGYYVVRVNGEVVNTTAKVFLQ